MGTRKICGVTLTINGEHVDPESYHRCNECNSKTMLVSSCGEWAVDEECYKNGEDTPTGVPELVCVGEVSGHWCPTCEMLVSISYNFD